MKLCKIIKQFFFVSCQESTLGTYPTFLREKKSIFGNNSIQAKVHKMFASAKSTSLYRNDHRAPRTRRRVHLLPEGHTHKVRIAAIRIKHMCCNFQYCDGYLLLSGLQTWRTHNASWPVTRERPGVLNLSCENTLPTLHTH